MSKKKKKQEQPTKFQWDPGMQDTENLPQIHNLESDVEQGFIDEDARKSLERRQAHTGKALQSILSGRFGW